MSIKLHGKEYIEVKDRVQAAHAEESYSMLSEETFSMGGREYVRVYIDVKGKQYIGTAECKFGANPKTPDGMSPFECGETSALGRALGFAGYGVVESIASADEVVRNEENVAPAQPIDRDEALRELARPGPARAGKALGQAQPADEPPVINMEQARKQCRNQAYKQGIKTIADYERFCAGIIGKPTPETQADINKLNADLEQREKQPKMA